MESAKLLLTRDLLFSLSDAAQKLSEGKQPQSSTARRLLREISSALIPLAVEVDELNVDETGHIGAGDSFSQLRDRLTEIIDGGCEHQDRRIALNKILIKIGNQALDQNEYSSSNNLVGLFSHGCRACSEEERNSPLHRLLSSAKQAALEASDDDSDGDYVLIDEFDQPPDYPIKINDAIYKTLRKYAACTCPQSIGGMTADASVAHHKIKMLLRPMFELQPGEDLSLELIMAALPITKGSEVLEWQDLELVTSRRLDSSTKPKREVGWYDQLKKPFSNATKVGISGDDYLQEGDLCRYANSGKGRTIRIRLAGGRLKALEEATATKMQPLKFNSSLHLRRMLEVAVLPFKTKPLIAYVVAKSVWQFYNTEWMGNVWTDLDIHFMEEASHDESSTLLCKPYLDVRLGESSIGMAEYRSTAHERIPPGAVMHKYPILLSLGAILLEIATGRLITDPALCKWDARSINILWDRAFKSLNNDAFAKDCDKPLYRNAVSKCLDPGLFSDAEFSAKDPSQGLEERRSILYQQVVLPLRKLVEKSGWLTMIDEIQRTPIRRKTQQESNLNFAASSKAKSLSKGLDESKTEARLLSERSSGSIKSSDDWLREFEEINRRVDKEKFRRVAAPIRIAVLDTGCDLDAPLFRAKDPKDHIKGHRNFVGNEEDVNDSDGHGTHLVTLLVSVAPKAHVYVAKIANSSRDLKDSHDRVKKAIEYATDKALWNVDVVTMSFGFPSEIESIRETIVKAIGDRAEKLLFFAAAANEGMNMREMFPARIPQVVSVRGTDHSGFPCQDYNPSSAPDEQVFGTLAINVKSNSIARQADCRRSGCSVATPLAAAVAILMLHWAQGSSAFSDREIDRMKTQQYMTRIFRMLNNKANTCYVTPFPFFWGYNKEERVAKLKAVLAD